MFHDSGAVLPHPAKRASAVQTVSQVSLRQAGRFFLVLAKYRHLSPGEGEGEAYENRVIIMITIKILKRNT